MTSVKGKGKFRNGLGGAGIINAINLGTKNLPPIDLFHDIAPLFFEVKKPNILQSVYCLSEEEKKIGYSPDEENADSNSDRKIDDF